MDITIRETISDSFRILGVETRNQPAEDDAYPRALRLLKSYLSILSQQDLYIFTRSPYNSLDDILPCKQAAYMFVTSSFAVYIAPYFDIPPTDAGYQSAIKTMMDSENDVRTLFGPDYSSVFPGNLPVGAGNTYEQNSWDFFFYPDLDPDIYDKHDECEPKSIFSNKGSYNER